jgi:hypothetical protein
MARTTNDAFNEAADLVASGGHSGFYQFGSGPISVIQTARGQHYLGASIADVQGLLTSHRGQIPVTPNAMWGSLPDSEMLLPTVGHTSTTWHREDSRVMGLVGTSAKDGKLAIVDFRNGDTAKAKPFARRPS